MPLQSGRISLVISADVTTGRVLSGHNVTAAGCFVECHRAPRAEATANDIAIAAEVAQDRQAKAVDEPTEDAYAVADLFARLEKPQLCSPGYL